MLCMRYVRVHTRGYVCALQINGNNICLTRCRRWCGRCWLLSLVRIILVPSVDFASLYRERKKARERKRENLTAIFLRRVSESRERGRWKISSSEQRTFFRRPSTNRRCAPIRTHVDEEYANQIDEQNGRAKKKKKRREKFFWERFNGDE